MLNCSDLGLPEELWTELGSYQAANEWWLKKKAEIDAGVRPVPPEVERVIKTLRTKKAVLEAEGTRPDSRQERPQDVRFPPGKPPEPGG